MRNVRVESLVDYIEVIAGLADSAVYYRGAKDPAEDMKPTVVRSWQKNRRIRRDCGEEPRLSLWAYEARLVEAFQRQALPFLEAVPSPHGLRSLNLGLRFKTALSSIGRVPATRSPWTGSSSGTAVSCG